MSTPVKLLLVVALVLLLVGGGYVAARKLGSKEAANLAKLIPSARAALERLRATLEAEEGIEIFIGSTLRDDAEQAAILAKGTSTTTKSWHLTGRAVDAYPIDPKTGKPDLDGKNVDLFRRMVRVARKQGWTDLGFNQDEAMSVRKLKKADGSTLVDLGHIHREDGLTFDQALAQWVSAAKTSKATA